MAETVVLSAAKFNSTKELLGYLDADVPGYSSYRNTYVVGLFGMAVLAIPLNAAVASLLIQRQFWRSNVYILLFQVSDSVEALEQLSMVNICTARVYSGSDIFPLVSFFGF